MGVQGLWELLTPVGRRVSVDALGSRKLAIDASIWIIQFMKAMRDDKGDMIRNAHLLGFFRRICKLLYLRIKPVFVFDGATPALKRRTVIARRRQREQAQSKIRKTAEKLLLNHLRTRKLEEIASDINRGSQSKGKSSEDVENTPVVDGTSDEQSRSNAQVDSSGPSAAHGKYDREATDALLAATLAADYGENLENGSKSPDESDEESDEEQLILPAVKGLDPSVLASLPPSMQLDLLVQMREQLVAENRQKFQKVAEVPSSFSQMQIQAYLKTVAFRREINEVQKAAAGVGVGGVPTARVASTIDREFIFSKSFEGEKPAPSDVEGQRRSEQATPPKTTHAKLPASLMNRSSALFSSITGTQETAAPEEDGVVSLVSTELKKDNDLNSNSVVHTYIDERGFVRVNRRRGMGVRMTRDLQWNLYLMKDVQARKEGESVSVSPDEPPIIPSTNTRETALPTALSPSQSNSITEQGLQISFVDDGISELSKEEEDGDLFDELVAEGGDSKDDQASAIQGPTFHQSDVDPITSAAGVMNGEDVEEEVDWEDGGINESMDGSVVEDRDLAEAVRLSLAEQPPASAHHDDDLQNQILLEDGPSSGESEVEWEDGTGDVAVDLEIPEELTEEPMLGPSEQAEFEEAIRRSLEDFHPPPKPLSQLVIKEPTERNTSSESRELNVPLKASQAVRAEAESEEVYLARERTRKGKAVLEGDEEVSLPTVVRRPSSYPRISEQDQIAAMTLSEMPAFETGTQPAPRTVDDPPYVGTTEAEGNLNFRSIQIPEATHNSTEKAKTDFPSKPQNVENFVGEVETSVQVDQANVESLVGEVETAMQVDQTNVENFVGEVKTSVQGDQTNVESSTVEVPDISAVFTRSDGPDRETLADIQPSDKLLDDTELEPGPSEIERGQEQAGLPVVTDAEEGNAAALRPPQPVPGTNFNEEDTLKEAEEIDVAVERKEQQSREAALSAEREKLAAEEANLQELLEVEQAELRAGLDRERELLEREEAELLAAQKKNERNADSVTGEMFTEVQELLQMFGLPYLIAPMEAEAQCAFMDTIELVDGVVTDDSDVFLFGGRTVYKNLFDDRKYVETYYMKDLESEMGMSREKMVRIAMLLGSDYTEGISGIGIVNAIEVVNAFPEEDGLKKFKEWLDSPDHALFRQYKGKGKGNGRGDKTGAGDGLDGDGEGDVDETENGKFTVVQQSFMHKHRAVSKNWNIPESFPSESVVAAYVEPVVDKSAEKFTWGRPDLEALRRFCYERFIWSKEKADELLLPVLKEYDRRETQTRLESFFHFNQRFAKIRSRRIQKAITGMTGKRSAELMDLPPHLITETKPKKPRRKKNPLNPSGAALEGNDMQQSSSQNDGNGAVDTGHREAGRGRRGRLGRRGGKQQSGDLGSNEPLVGTVDPGQDVEDAVTNGEARRKPRARAPGRGRGRGRSGGRGRGRGRAADDDEASISDSSDSDGGMEEAIAEIDSLKRNAETVQPRRSTRQRAQVPSYQVDHSDGEAGGTYSDGEELFKEVDLLVAEALRKKPKRAASGIESVETGVAVSSSDMSKEGARLEDNSVMTDIVGPSETSEFAAGGGFCPDEDELGHTGQETREPAYALGGGFCLSDDEHDPPQDVGNVTLVEDNPQIQHFRRMEGGLCLSDEEEMVLRETGTDFPEEHVDQHVDNSPLEKVDIDSSRELNRSRVMPETSISGNGIPFLSQSSEPAEFGLRAMPLMRRKKRKERL